MDSISALLLSHFEDPYHRGSCERATHIAQFHDLGSQHYIAIQLRIDEQGTIEEAWFDSQGCMQCEGAASILVQYCEGKSIDDFEELDEAFYLKLTEQDLNSESSSCQLLAWNTFQAALHSTDVDDERPLFGGPSLGEES